MNAIEALVKTILLLATEKKLYNGLKSEYIGREIIKHIMLNKGKYFNGDAELLNNLLNILNNILEEGIEDPSSLASSLATALIDRPTLSTLVLQEISNKVDATAYRVKKNELINFLAMLQVKDILDGTRRKLKGNVNVKKLVSELVEKIHEIVDFEEIQDDSIISEVDFDNDDKLHKAVEDSAALLESNTVFSTGWSCINEMLQGGLRKGEFVLISALPHNYKSGFTKSLFLQIARLNKPQLEDKDKKPLMIFFSFEEDMNVVLMFFYSYFKFLKEGVAVDPSKDKIDRDEMKNVLKKYMKEESNFDLKILRMDPSKTTYMKMVDIIDKYNKNGYEVQAVFADYLSQISTEGCVQKGPAGTEYKDLFKRMRNEMTKRKILFVTPHQISTEAKRLIKNGIPAIEFVKHLPGKGYYAHSSQLDQEVDLEIFLHKATVNRKPVLTVQRGKHRIPTIVDEDKLFTMLQFPKKAPIPEDCEHFKPCQNTNLDEDFGF